MTKTRLLIKNACYHIYVRGNQKQTVFKEKEDFEFYLRQLKYYKRKYFFSMYGYCLMPNHIHLIGEPLCPEKLPKFMQCLQRSYTAYYNKKYTKVGHLWQNRFKAKVITKDGYLLNCLAYIEQNPIRANLVQKIEKYEFSSYQERNLIYTNYSALIDKLLF
ncbi:MAG: transposase [Candidatus Omnitrophota bacterium]|nr:transposase [Candidatus Omnitrophota bacterium]MBU2035525.1 transposase [Candidatus Omnitrophota bacterium]MBU2257539.1 transposase [Candidatus Omnitrophota bacterium]